MDTNETHLLGAHDGAHALALEQLELHLKPRRLQTEHHDRRAVGDLI